MGLIIFINTLPLSGLSNGFEIWFWGGILMFMSYLMVFGSIYLYYDQEYDFEYDSLKVLYNKLRTLKKRDIPKLILIVCINTFTLGMYIYATITKPNFTDWLLGVTIINMIIYFLYYIIQKINNREKISYIIWIWLLLDIIVIVLSLIFFMKSVTDKLLPLDGSNKLNEPCVLFNYFDYHDIWHIFSSIGLFIFVNIVYFMDNNTFEEEINIF